MIRRPVAAVLLACYSVFVARLTLADPSAGRWAFHVADVLARRASDGRLEWSETEVLANVALFVPAGFLLAVVLGRPLLAAVLAVLASACIELAQQQFLPTRVPSLADVVHNGLGGLLGAVLAAPFSRVQRSTVGRPQRAGQY
ncbi:VanZ family protein [Nocardioides humi]|uniref:VanZ-like domain-containing protein n=1 Tax=Nocardioides humi TaxID=449461 RepID=A0ABN2A7G3_9ACTN|nr:VanZ family protein [Nocardioides humi]